MDDNVGAPLVGAHENISRVEPNENNQGTHKGCPYGDVTLGEIVGAREAAPLLSAVPNVFIWKQTRTTKVCASADAEPLGR